MDSNGSALVPLNAVRNLDEAMHFGELAFKSGMFGDLRSAAQGVMKILAGAELGFSPLASLTAIHFYDGKIDLGAHLRAATIRRSGRYDYEVKDDSRQRCELEFFELTPKRRSLGNISMTIEEAIKDGIAVAKDGSLKKNWERTPDDMLFARCISKGFRRHCPDLTGGVPTYDTDELVESAGPVVDAEFTVVPPTQPEPQPETPPASDPLITEDQANHLAMLTRGTAAGLAEPERAAKVQAVAQELLNRYAIRGYRQLPALHYADACQWLEGQAPKAASPSRPAPAEALTPDTKDVDRVAKLVDELGLNWTAFRERLQEKYQQTSLAHVTLVQLREIEDGLRKSKAVRAAKVPAKGGEPVGASKS